ncbi:MAG: hypothetical protein FH753_15990 [Firmicutes bacterium]|nr:hypothetical protein [Bacillota bacterium]
MRNTKKLKKMESKASKIVILTLMIFLLASSVAFADGDPIENVSSYALERIGTVFIVIVSFYIVKNVAKNATNRLIGFLITAVLGAVIIYKPELLKKLADWLFNVIF